MFTIGIVRTKGTKIFGIGRYKNAIDITLNIPKRFGVYIWFEWGR